MYYLPELYETRDYLLEIRNPNQLEICRDYCKFEKYPCNKDVFDLCSIIMEELEVTKPEDPYDMIGLYIHLRNEINGLLNDEH